MKKNTMMRIASVLLVAVLLSTCAISGTFAKYTSQYTGSADRARYLPSDTLSALLHPQAAAALHRGAEAAARGAAETGREAL